MAGRRRAARRTEDHGRAETEAVGAVDDARPVWWEAFFSRQRSPVLRSQLITAIMAGRRLEAERLPAGVLLDAVVTGMAARSYHNAEIVDDWWALLRRTDEAWASPEWTCRTFDQYHMNAAGFIIRGMEEFCCTEDMYVSEFTGWMLARSPPEYFTEELPDENDAQAAEEG